MKIFPDFIKKLDQYLLVNYPLIWVFKLHYFLFFNLVYAIPGMLILGFVYPIAGKLTPNFLAGNKAFSELIIVNELNHLHGSFFFVFLIGFLVWIIYLKETRPKIISLSVFYIFFLYLVSIHLNIFIFYKVLATKISEQITTEQYEEFSHIFFQEVTQFERKEEIGAKNFLNLAGEVYHLDYNKAKKNVSPASMGYRDGDGITKKVYMILLRDQEDFKTFKTYVTLFQLEELIVPTNWSSTEFDFLRPFQPYFKGQKSNDAISFPFFAYESLHMDWSNKSNLFFAPFHLIRQSTKGDALVSNNSILFNSIFDPSLLLFIITIACYGFLFYVFKFETALGSILLGILFFSWSSFMSPLENKYLYSVISFIVFLTILLLLFKFTYLKKTNFKSFILACFLAGFPLFLSYETELRKLFDINQSFSLSRSLVLILLVGISLIIEFFIFRKKNLPRNS